MENNKDQASLVNIEKAKALFEYEMTAVLLAVTESKEAERRLVEEYMEMEIEKPQLKYASPEFEAKGIETAPPEQTGSAPEFAAPEVTVSVSGLPQVGETAAFTAPVLTAETDLRESVEVSLPETAAARFSAEGLSAASQPAELPKISITAPELPSAVRPIEGARAEISAAAPDIDLPAAKLRQPGISVQLSAAAPDIRLPEIPRAAAAAMPAAPEVKGISAGFSQSELKKAPGFELPGGQVTADGVKVPAVQRMGAFAVPAVPAPQLSAAADVGKAGKISPAAFELPPAAPVSVSVDYKPAVPVSFELADIPGEKLPAPEYPEIPDKPDISAAAAEILEAVRAEL